MRRTAAVLAAAALALAGCGSSGTSSDQAGTAGTSGGKVTGTVTVLAAASLTGTFTALAKDFEASHPGTHVQLGFGGSSALAQQVVQGAPADVLATASPSTMQQVVDHGDAASPTTFARNTLEIAVPPGNPAHVTSLADLARPGTKVALCAQQVPCGAAATKLLAQQGLTVRPATLEQDVKAALTKVRLGEVDAALVYRTDVAAAGKDVLGVPVPEAAKVVNDYPVVTLEHAPNPSAATAFVDLVLSAKGRQVLSAAGFGLP